VDGLPSAGGAADDDDDDDDWSVGAGNGSFRCDHLPPSIEVRRPHWRHLSSAASNRCAYKNSKSAKKKS